MISIEYPPSDSLYLTILYRWFEEEWGEVDPFSSVKNGKVIPSPVIALDGSELVGGLAFTRFVSPLTKAKAIWINAVFIKPENRKQGVSSLLIGNAEKVVKQMGETELLVYTNIPKLYLKQGWKIIETHDDHFVLKSSLV